MTFTEAKQEFDSKYESVVEFDCFIPEHLTFNKKTNFKKKNGTKNEQYYKWQFLYAIIQSGLYTKDYIGTEVQFPKGNKSSAPLKLDGAIFDDITWFDKYKDFHENGNNESLEWLRKHLICVIEFKKEDNKNVADVWDKQLKAYLKESECDFCLGIMYDTERLYLFKKQENKFLRLNENYNSKKEDSKTKDLQLHLFDAYYTIPSYKQLLNKVYHPKIDRSKRTIHDLEIISGVYSSQLKDGIANILHTMDKVSLTNERGYEILVQMIALKIFDEKKNIWLKYYIQNEEKDDIEKLKFYIEPSERDYRTLNDKNVLEFTKRIKDLKEKAETTYKEILSESIIDFKNESHVKVVATIVNSLQDYSFTKSSDTDLWQIVFYQFANAFSKAEKGQFLTPIPLIKFIVNIVNPKEGETLIDPTSGSADFLSVSYIASQSDVNDKNIFGVDNDEQMIRLAQLNMLLNGDGRSTLKFQSGLGSISHKFDRDNNLFPLNIDLHKNGNWEFSNDYTKLKKFNIVLTNPPFGDNRAFEPKTSQEKELLKCYELWNIYNAKKIDLGIIFLENAYRILEDYGRLGIVVSNSIASIDSHKLARKWLMEKMRITAIFDMPSGIFGETSVNTSVIIAYKLPENELKKLKNQNYEVFFRNIEKVGYEVKTSNRIKVFNPTYKVNYDNFIIEKNEKGEPILDEDFTETISDFKKWCLRQEKYLQDIFI
ncbi:MAG: N-6 DNA methylase, partial [Chitinophagaceae bacterium]|nr:N-6 DNA methylase [Chitinophagaceae bacterium]